MKMLTFAHSDSKPIIRKTWQMVIYLDSRNECAASGLTWHGRH